MTLKDELRVPVGWYHLGPDSHFSNPTIQRLPGVDLVVYRGDSGRLYAVQARCPHMNADFTRAQVRGESLQCSLHHWTFNNQGKCTGIPGARASEIPSQACLNVYSIETRGGHVFVHTEANTEQKLPFFRDENADDFSSARPRRIEGWNHWTVAAANAFDIAHFEFVHFRRPTRPPKLMLTSEQSIFMHLSYEILGESLADRWLIKKYGKQAQLEYTVYDGNVIAAKTTIGKFTNRMMIFVSPLEDRFEANLFVYTPKSHSLTKSFQREMTAYFSYQFFAKECLELKGVELNPETFGPKDHLLVEYVAWLRNRYGFQENLASVSESGTSNWQKIANTTPVTISKT